MSRKAHKIEMAAPAAVAAFAITTDPTTSRNYDAAFTEEDANIVLRSSDDIYYRIPSFTLRTTSGFFRGMMTLPPPDGKSHDHDDPITLDEKSEVVGMLLRMISGFEIPKWKSFDELEDLLAAAYKYDMRGPMATARTTFFWPFSLEQPLRQYAVAARYGWEEEAKCASTLSLSIPIYDEAHASILERVPSPWLLRLFGFHRARREGFKKSTIAQKDSVIFGISRCKCGSSQNTDALLELARLMLWEMDRCPAGGALLSGEWKQWPEAKKCLQGAKCHGRNNTYLSCNSPDYTGEIDSAVKAALQSLPSTI
jgi:hypothetical protein